MPNAPWLLLVQNFPALPKVLMRADATDAAHAVIVLGLKSGLGAANIATGPREARALNLTHWVEPAGAAITGEQVQRPRTFRRRRRA